MSNPAELFPEDELPFACTAFIRAKLDQNLSLINAKIASRLASVKPTPQFNPESQIGELPVTSTPYMTVNMGAVRTGGPISGRAVGGVNHYMPSFTFFITALIPLAGDNLAVNYEVMLQAAAGYTLKWLQDSKQSLLPVVSLASIPDIAVMGVDGIPGDLVPIFPSTQADGVTVQRGFKIPYTIRFDVAGGYATTTVPKGYVPT